MKILRKLNACESGAGWAESKSSYKEAWDQCERGDWMLWIAKKRNIDLKILTKAKVECAKLVEHLMADERSINALRVCERFYEGTASRKELYSAAADAYAAAAVAADAAADAAYAAAAADAYAAADAAAVAAYTTSYNAAVAEEKRKEILKKCADICRQYINFEDLNIEEGY